MLLVGIIVAVVAIAAIAGNLMLLNNNDGTGYEQQPIATITAVLGPHTKLRSQYGRRRTRTLVE